MTTCIAALRIIARSAPSPSSPAPSARRCRRWGLTARRGRAIRRPFHKCTFVMLAEIDFMRLSDNDRWVEYWFSHFIDLDREHGAPVALAGPVSPLALSRRAHGTRSTTAAPLRRFARVDPALSNS